MRHDSAVRSPGDSAEPFLWKVDPRCTTSAEPLAQWRALAQRAPPMLAPEFALLTARLIGETEVILAGARRGATLTAALPIARRGRKLQALRSEHSPRVDFVGEPSSLPALWRALRQAGGWDVLELRGVPADSPLACVLPQLARDDRCRVHVRETGRSPYFSVSGIEHRIHRRFRGDMRRLERQMGGVTLERIAVFDRTALSDVIRLEAASWKGKAGTAIQCDARLVRFYTTLARVFARRSELSVAFLRSRGERIAAQFALEDATTFYLLKVGYDPAFAHYGPGQILVRETAADAARRGLARYDLLGKDTAWKMKWTDLVQPHVEVTIYAPSTLGAARHFLREVARPVVGRAARRLRAIRGQPS